MFYNFLFGEEYVQFFLGIFIIGLLNNYIMLFYCKIFFNIVINSFILRIFFIDRLVFFFRGKVLYKIIVYKMKIIILYKDWEICIFRIDFRLIIMEFF